MKKIGSELIFLYRIKPDGTGLDDVTEVSATLHKTEFNLFQLSITHQTFIAHSFHSYIVKIKS